MLTRGDRRMPGADRAESDDPAILCRDFARALDPCAIMREAEMEPDPWQRGVLESEGVDELLLCCRQAGKSTTTASKALNRALYHAPALVLVINPALRQSVELLRKARDIHSKLKGAPEAVGDSTLKMEFASGSRIIALPGSDATIRGYSAADLVIVDEASRVDDDLVAAIRPMLAVSRGNLIALTTPFGKRGWFYKAWTEGGKRWRRTKITADQCPRIDPDWLERERLELGDWLWRQEYGCEFMDTSDQMFPTALIDAAISAEVSPLW